MNEEESSSQGLRARSEEALGEVAHALLENPVLNGALGKALGAGERAMQAQRSAMEALDLPTASDVERLGRRLRSLSDRLEAIEDALDSVSREVVALREQQAPRASSKRTKAGSNKQ